jgi:hypothetical protein
VPVCLAGAARPRPFLAGVRLLLTAPDYLSFAPPGELEALEAFEKRGGKIVKYHPPDRPGSQMYIEAVSRRSRSNLFSRITRRLRAR